MPKVTKKKKPPAKKRSSRSTSRSKKTSPAFFERLAELAKRYTLAGLAGVVVILAGAVSILWAGGYVGVMTERASSIFSAGAVAAGFGVKKVTLKGRDQVSPDEVETALGPVLGESILNLDLDAARVRIEEIGWVRAAAVSRLLPDTVNVSIREREPAAVWQISGALHLIDADGADIREIGAYEYSSLPLIVGAGAPEAAAGILKALGAHPELKEKTSALVRVGERRWNMRLRNGLDVKLPDSGFGDALDTLATLQKTQGILDQPLEYIDLRDPERMVLRRRGETPEEEGR